MPLDPQGGGTWILVAEDGEAACLLNGAFVNHNRKPPYRKSRGRVIVEFFTYSNTEAFISQYDFEQIEPFTLVKVIKGQNPTSLHELRWDGRQIHHHTFDPNTPKIWSSVTLYDEAMRAKRQQWFGQWLEKSPDFTTESIRHFHLQGGEGDPSVDFKMTRGEGLQTISLTCISVSRGVAEVDYQSLINGQRQQAKLTLEAN